jgi:hypothetical protein
LLLLALSSLDSLFLLSDFGISFALGFRSISISVTLGLGGFSSSLRFSFGPRLRSRVLALLRDTLLLLALNCEDPGVPENCAVCRAVEITAFLSALLAREFSAILRLPSALENISGAYLSAPRAFEISTALRASYISRGTFGSRVRAKGFPIFSYCARFKSLYSLMGKIFPFVSFRLSLWRTTISLGKRTAK